MCTYKDIDIRYNFHEGLKNTQQHLCLFDNLTFIDGNSDYVFF